MYIDVFFTSGSETDFISIFCHTVGTDEECDHCLSLFGRAMLPFVFSFTAFFKNFLLNFMLLHFDAEQLPSYVYIYIYIYIYIIYIYIYICICIYIYIYIIYRSLWCPRVGVWCSRKKSGNCTPLSTLTKTRGGSKILFIKINLLEFQWRTIAWYIYIYIYI